MKAKQLETVVEGLRFPEGNRWHQGALWFVDMHSGEILRLDVGASALAVIAAVEGQASGLGWLKTGQLIVSAMDQRRILNIADDGSQSTYCDLTRLSNTLINDLVVDIQTDRVYVGAFGYDAYGGARPRTGPVYVVESDCTPRIATEGLAFPNGAVILPDSRTLVIAETWGGRMTAFEINDHGDLVNRRVWAELEVGVMPDGNCVDLDGGIWIASLQGGEFQRVVEGGRVTERIRVQDRHAIDCVLGGTNGTTLYVSTADSVAPRVTAGNRQGRIQAVEVSVPGPVS